MSFFLSVAGLMILAAVLSRWLGASRGSAAEAIAGRDAQLARLSEEMDALQSEVRRLGEEQSFMVRLLTEGDRAPGAAPPPGTGPDLPNPENR